MLGFIHHTTFLYDTTCLGVDLSGCQFQQLTSGLLKATLTRDIIYLIFKLVFRYLVFFKFGIWYLVFGIWQIWYLVFGNEAKPMNQIALRNSGYDYEPKYEKVDIHAMNNNSGRQRRSRK